MYTLDTGGEKAPPGRTKDQVTLDQLYCKDKARDAQSGNPARDFLLGLTIVGAPVAIEQDKIDARKAYVDCMATRGYMVTTGTD